MQASKKFRVDIHGLRGIAVLLVVLYHLKLWVIPGGYIGVDIFFVISGYLITSHLRDALNSNRFNFSDFYAKRIRRIIPASIFVLVCTIVLSCVLLPPLILPQVLKESIATALYVPNVYHALQQTDYLADTSVSPFLHYWSLGVEEQFYLLWPLILFLLLKVLKLNKNILIPVILIILLASFLGNYFLTKHSQSWSFFLIFTRAWELIAGGLLALFTTGRNFHPKAQSKIVGFVCGWSGIVLLGYCAVIYNEATEFPGAAAALPVLGAILVIFAGTVSNATAFNKILAKRLLQYLGTISYSLYLWHWPVIIFAEELFPDLNTTTSLILLFAVSVCLADITYRFVEQPFRFKAPNVPAKSVLTYSLSASMMITVIIGGYGYQLKSQPLYIDKTSQTLAPTTHPDFTGFVPSNLTPALRQAKNSFPGIYGDGCHDDFFTTNARGCSYGETQSNKTYVLFGDSHAAQWFPALEKYTQEHNIHLITFTKSACPSLDLRILLRGSEYLNCAEWYKKVITKINAINPDLIILSNYQEGQNSVIAADKKQEWKNGLQRTINHFPGKTNVIVIGDTPSFERAPAICLSENISAAEKCSFPRETLLDSGLAEVEKEVAIDNRKHYIDMNNYLCSSTTCGPIIGNILVYRDQHHLTTTFSKQLSDMLGNAIEAKLAQFAAK